MSDLLDFAANKPRRTARVVHRFRRLDVEGQPVVELPGRVGWAVNEIYLAGAGGVSTLERPAPRWSDYVFKARRRYGLNIETVDEKHGGVYAGEHGRYYLRERLELVADAGGQLAA